MTFQPKYTKYAKPYIYQRLHEIYEIPNIENDTAS